MDLGLSTYAAFLITTLNTLLIMSKTDEIV